MYLWFIDEHPHVSVSYCIIGCDLLSKCIFDLLTNTNILNGLDSSNVVICFQNVSLIYWRTPETNPVTSRFLLWFAFKMYLWFIDEQHQDQWLLRLYCCDLLSKCIFDLLTNNGDKGVMALGVVVICFQNVSLIYWRTTQTIFKQ